PGRIWTSEKPAWIIDVTKDENFPRARLCADIDVRGAFGFPVKVAADVVAILEFFANDEMEPDDDLLNTVRTVGEQLGRVIERKRAQERIVQSEMELSDFFDNASVGLHCVALDGTILRANQCELDMLGYAREEYLGHHIADFHVDQDVIEEILNTLVSGETLNNCPARLRSKDGTVKHVLINSNVYQENGVFTHSRCFTRDVTARKIAEDKLLASDARMRAILDSAVDAIITIDSKGRIDSFNPAAEQMFGYEAHEAVGNNVNMLMPSPYKGQHDGYLAKYQETGQKKIIGIGREVTGLRKDGSTFPLELTISEVVQGDLKLFTGILRDISERKVAEQAIAEANRMLQRQASTDGLTNLANRSRFYEVIEEEWKRHQRSDESLSVVLLDVDCFKNYNDSLGHLAGDDCLRAIASAIKASLLRAGDFAARYGGEEFAVVLPNTDIQGAATVCEVLRQSVLDLSVTHPDSVAGKVVTISTGYSTLIPSPDISVRDFLHQADVALYHAKEQGRNCVVSHNDITSLLIP
ncbi:MAG: PAS domain S-box protein, partial [Aeoliella sp.]